MNLIHRHDWDVEVSKAIALQKQLATEVVYNRPLNGDRVELFYEHVLM